VAGTGSSPAAPSESLSDDSLATVADQAQSGGIRAAVLGINDGLVTNVSLILGVAGGAANPEFVKLAGLASLVAGACSMAVGEFVSMQAQVDLLQRVLKPVRSAFKNDAKRASGLSLAFEKEGLSKETAAEAARDMGTDQDRAVQFYSRTVLGVNPSELGSPWTAAGASLVTFAIGALVPLVPWYFLAPSAATTASITLSAVAAFIIGALLGHYTDGRILRGGLRQTIVIALAAGVTYGVGHLFHVNVQ